jgi:hypothetical protein
VHTTAKHCVAGTVKGTAPYRDFCNFFMNEWMATGIKLKDYIMYKHKERIKAKRLIILNVIDNIE